MKVSKIVNNTNNWKSISGIAQTGIMVNTIGLSESFFLGLEEWNNSEILRKLKLAYLDSFRSVKRTEYFDCINLINYKNGIVYLVGKIEGVKQLENDEIEEIRNTLSHHNWLPKIKNDFTSLNETQIIENPQEYLTCWNSEEIVAPTNQSFILNLRYEKILFLKEPINLTELDIRANNWRRLSKLFVVNDDLEFLFDSI